MGGSPYFRHGSGNANYVLVVELAEYQKWLSEVPYGKRLPTALYVFYEGDHQFGELKRRCRK
jgi:hypothetical protein